MVARASLKSFTLELFIVAIITQALTGTVECTGCGGHCAPPAYTVGYATTQSTLSCSPDSFCIYADRSWTITVSNPSCATTTVSGWTCCGDVINICPFCPTSPPFSLCVGANSLVWGTASNPLQTATIVRYNDVSAISALSITTPASTLSPSFLSTTLTYALTTGIPYAYTSIVLAYTMSDTTYTSPNAYITYSLNSATATTDNRNADPTLTISSFNVGVNTLVLKGYAQDASYTTTYTLTIVRYNNQARVNTFTLTQPSSLSLTPAFISSTFTYALTTGVLYSVTSLTFSYTMLDTVYTNFVTSSLSYNINSGASTVSHANTASSLTTASALVVGANTLTITGYAQDVSVTQSYTITVVRYNNVCSISSFSFTSPSSITIIPMFTSSLLSYTTTTVTYLTTSVTFSYTMSDVVYTTFVSAHIQYSVSTSTGTTTSSTVSGTGTVPLTVGSNTLTVIAYAQDSTYTNTYTFVIVRLSNVCTLSSLSLSSASLSPSFSSSTTAYTAVMYAPSFTFTYTLTDSTNLPMTAKVVYVLNNLSPISVFYSSSSSLSSSSVVTSPLLTVTLGANTLTVTVYAEDSTYSTVYTVTITALTPSSSLTPASSSVTPSSSQIQFSSSLGPSSSQVQFSSSKPASSSQQTLFSSSADSSLQSQFSSSLASSGVMPSSSQTQFSSMAPSSSQTQFSSSVTPSSSHTQFSSSVTPSSSQTQFSSSGTPSSSQPQFSSSETLSSSQIPFSSSMSLSSSQLQFSSSVIPSSSQIPFSSSARPVFFSSVDLSLFVSVPGGSSSSSLGLFVSPNSAVRFQISSSSPNSTLSSGTLTISVLGDDAISAFINKLPVTHYASSFSAFDVFYLNLGQTSSSYFTPLATLNTQSATVMVSFVSDLVISNNVATVYKGNATVLLRLISPPVSTGVVTFSPSSGTALETSFNVSTAVFTTSTGAATYRFFRQSAAPDDSIVYLHSDPITLTSADSTSTVKYTVPFLPQAAALFIGVEVCDVVTLACTRVLSTSTLTVSAPSVAFDSNSISSFTTRIASSADPASIKVENAIAIASQLAQTNSANTSSGIAATNSLIALVNANAPLTSPAAAVTAFTSITAIATTSSQVARMNVAVASLLSSSVSTVSLSSFFSYLSAVVAVSSSSSLSLQRTHQMHLTSSSSLSLLLGESAIFVQALNIFANSSLVALGDQNLLAQTSSSISVGRLHPSFSLSTSASFLSSSAQETLSMIDSAGATYYDFGIAVFNSPTTWISSTSSLFTSTNLTLSDIVSPTVYVTADATATLASSSPYPRLVVTFVLNSTCSSASGCVPVCAAWNPTSTNDWATQGAQTTPLTSTTVQCAVNIASYVTVFKQGIQTTPSAFSSSDAPPLSSSVIMSSSSVLSSASSSLPPSFVCIANLIPPLSSSSSASASPLSSLLTDPSTLSSSSSASSASSCALLCVSTASCAGFVFSMNKTTGAPLVEEAGEVPSCILRKSVEVVGGSRVQMAWTCACDWVVTDTAGRLQSGGFVYD